MDKVMSVVISDGYSYAGVQQTQLSLWWCLADTITSVMLSGRHS